MQLPSQSHTPKTILRLGDVREGIEPAGASVREALEVYPDGDFHLERRFQPMGVPRSTLSIFEAKLTNTQLQTLQIILDQIATEQIPDYRPPAFPLSTTRLEIFTAEFNRTNRLIRVGYFAPAQSEQSDSAAHTASASPFTEQDWETSKTALQPLVNWFRDFSSTLTTPTTSPSHTCPD
jgi:hypothetical protein